MVCLKLKGNTNQYNLTLRFSGVSHNIKYIKDNTLYAVNTEIFVRILSLGIILKDIFGIIKICEWCMIYLHQ